MNLWLKDEGFVGLVDRVVKTIIEMGPNFMYSKLVVKNITCIVQATNQFELKEVHIGPIENY